MKRLLALLLLLALIGAASATSLNFQNPGDLDQVRNLTIRGSTVGTVTWSESGIGGNNYVVLKVPGVSYEYNTVCVINSAAYQTTYAAATKVTGLNPTGTTIRIQLMDSSFNQLATWNPDNYQTLGRYELKMVGGTPYYYVNGNIANTGSPIAQNPSYVGFCEMGAGTTSGVGWDDFVYGGSENRYVFGLPESDNEMYVILKDITNPSAAGLAFGSNGTVVNSNYMVGTWSRGNDTTPLANESIQLVNYVTGTVYETAYTGNAFTGSHSFDILTNVINNPNAPQGLYAITIPGSGAYSNQIWYKSNGASVAWSSKTYSMQDTGSIITVVASGGYWDTSTYSYSLGVMDVYGQWHGTNTSITTQTSTVTHSWNSDTDSPGVYYAVLTATSRSTGVSYILGYDYTTLSSYANFAGTVHDAQSGLPISGAFVNFTQDGFSANSTTIADGNYTANGFSTGSNLTVSASASSYIPYNYSFIPLAAKGAALNISLVPSTPTFTGLAIGGVDRDTTYGRPIGSATVTVRNTTTGETYQKTTSMTGWYLCDFGSSCSLATKTPYDVWAFKLGYTNSTTEKAVTL